MFQNLKNWHKLLKIDWPINNQVAYLIFKANHWFFRIHMNFLQFFYVFEIFIEIVKKELNITIFECFYSKIPYQNR